MSTFIIADTHFGEENIITYAHRPFENAIDMDERMIRRWNSVVSEEDVVFHLGDVGNPEVVKKLNGHKILIMGNHDMSHSQDFWREAGFNEVSRFPVIYNDFIVLEHEPPTFYSDEVPYAWIYGHVHDTEMYQTVTRRSACVSVERWNYTPVELNEIIRRMKELE